MQTPEKMLYQLEQTDHNLLKSQLKELKVDQFKRLLQKFIKESNLHEKMVQNDQVVTSLIDQSFTLLLLCMEQDLANNIVKRDYILTMRSLTKHLYQHYKVVHKGYYVGQYLSLGLIFGAGIGIALFTSNPGLYSIGISLGLVLGVSIGNSLENKAIKEGLLY